MPANAAIAGAAASALLGGIGGGVIGKDVANNRYPQKNDPIVSYEPPTTSPQAAVEKLIQNTPGSEEWTPAKAVSRHAVLLGEEIGRRAEEERKAYELRKIVEQQRKERERQRDITKTDFVIGGVAIGTAVNTLAMPAGAGFAAIRRRKKEEEKKGSGTGIG